MQRGWRFFTEIDEGTRETYPVSKFTYELTTIDSEHRHASRLRHAEKRV